MHNVRRGLAKDGTPYLIHKAFHRGEVIFEYAVSAVPG